MSFSPRFFIFIITLIFLTGIGLIAGFNLIIHPEMSSSSQRIESIIPIQNASSSGVQMISEEPYIVATTSASILIPVPVPKPHNQISASAYLVGNVLTGKIYLSSNVNQALPVASMSKLITAIVSTDTMSPTTIEVTPLETEVASDTSNLLSGEKFTLKEILQPLLLSSSNVAAEAIASSSNRNAFMGLMSSIACEIGMPTAYFADPSGIDPHNEASANDMFALAQYLYTSRPDILAITRTPHTFIATTTDHGSHVVDSTHPFIKDSRFIGGKTGRTPEAGETMLTIFRIANQPIAFIVLHSDIGERAHDTQLLIDAYTALGQ